MRARHGEPVRWLLSQAAVDDEHCRPWPFGQTHGYGAVRYKGRTWNAHRLLCLLVHGEPEAGQTDVAHSCGNRLCCNPRHLRHATPAENQGDKAKHGTVLKGAACPSAKLSEADVVSIRSAISSTPSGELAKRFGVSSRAIRLIASRVNWAHVA
jgi:hypothetical protein